jgi:tetratricopeptide (TPR) repeat protein
MLCPFCQTENRDNREKCYACDKDISMLRLIVNKARHHYNLALEHAERGRTFEAINELKNSLDLDRRFVAAHVVLGTLYAKQNEFDLARESWNNALTLNPELAKAHDYLDRVRNVEKSLPVLRTFKLLLSALAALLVVSVIALVYAYRPDPAERILVSAQRAYDEGDVNKALRELARLSRTGRKDSPVRVAGQSLGSAIRADNHQHINVIQELKFREQFPAALAEIARLESHGIDAPTSAALSVIKADIDHYYRDKLDALAAEHAEGTLPYGEFADKVREFLRVYPESPEKADLNDYLERARDQEVERQFAAIRATFVAHHDARAAFDQVQKLAAEFPGSDTLKKLRADLVDEVLSSMFEKFQDHLDGQRFDEAHALLKEISSLAAEFRDVVDVTAAVGLALRVLGDTEVATMLKNAENLVRTGGVAEAQAALDALSAEDLTSAEQDLVNACQTELDARTAQEQVKRLRSREQAFLSLQITDREASDTLALYDRLAQTLPDKAKEDRARATAYAAASALVLHDRNQAAELLGLLERENRNSAMVKSIRSAQKKKNL